MFLKNLYNLNKPIMIKTIPSGIKNNIFIPTDWIVQTLSFLLQRYGTRRVEKQNSVPKIRDMAEYISDLFLFTISCSSKLSTSGFSFEKNFIK